MTTVEEPLRPPESPDQRESSTAAATLGLGLVAVVAMIGVLASWWRFPWAPGAPITPDLTWPFVVLAVGVGVVIVLIAVVGLHAFLSLILAAVVAGLMTQVGTLRQADLTRGVKGHYLNAIELTAQEFGRTAAGIGIVIVLAAVIGMALLESGAADRVVRTFLRIFGEKRAGLALLLSTYVVSIPIFFDTIFMLLIPLARALRLRTGRDYLLYVMAICCAGVITHSMVIPHPGPLAMANDLKIDPGFSIFIGLLSGLLPLAAGWAFCVWTNRRNDIPLTDAPGASVDELRAIMNKPDAQLPGFWVSICPVILPVILIWIGSFTALFLGGRPGAQRLVAFGNFIGERHVALFIGTLIALAVLMRQRRIGVRKVGELIGPPLETAGVIILITAAGGAFGVMLRNAGVGDAIKHVFAGREVNLILLSYLVAAIIRVAQGSATVAMLTTSGMLAPLVVGTGLPYDPIYIFLSIGYGAMICSWMNDSGFWVVSRLSGLTERQTLRSWTMLVTVISIAGLLTTLLMAAILPKLFR